MRSAIILRNQDKRKQNQQKVAKENLKAYYTVAAAKKVENTQKLTQIRIQKKTTLHV
jgi:hypothetical protein